MHPYDVGDRCQIDEIEVMFISLGVYEISWWLFGSSYRKLPLSKFFFWFHKLSFLHLYFHLYLEILSRQHLRLNIIMHLQAN
jgi:hypothetical protein